MLENSPLMSGKCPKKILVRRQLSPIQAAAAPDIKWPSKWVVAGDGSTEMQH